jgi:hypothetical protein
MSCSTHRHIRMFYPINVPKISLFFCRNSERKDRDAYWDGGPTTIRAFEEQHGRACDENWVCRRLGLKNVIVEEEAPNESRRDCLKIANIIG